MADRGLGLVSEDLMRTAFTIVERSGGTGISVVHKKGFSQLLVESMCTPSLVAKKGEHILCVCERA